MRLTPKRFRPLLLATTMLVAAMTVACDRSPTAVDGVQGNALIAILEAADRAAPGSIEYVLRDAVLQLRSDNAAIPQLPGLSSLFDMAVSRVERERGVVSASRLRAEQRSVESAAWTTVAQGDAEAADRDLAEARTAMSVRTVEELGERAAVAYVAVVGLAIERTLDHFSTLPRTPALARPARMADAARHMHAEASQALLTSDIATALDLATHAADLLNTLHTRSPGFDAVRIP